MEACPKNVVAAGLDGCKGGWFMVGFDSQTFHACLLENLEELKAYTKLERIYIDMPMGLGDAKLQRTIEDDMRKLLGSQHSKVFGVPVRDAVRMAGQDGAGKKEKDEAKRINLAQTKDYLKNGKKRKKPLSISAQTLGICPKIKALDDFLDNNKTYQSIIYESHPEICFLKENERQSESGEQNESEKQSGNEEQNERKSGLLEHGKKTKDGRDERLKLIQDVIGTTPNATASFDKWSKACKRKYALKDDIIDAFMLAALATRSLGSPPPLLLDKEHAVDSEGIPIRIAL